MISALFRYNVCRLVASGDFESMNDAPSDSSVPPQNQPPVSRRVIWRFVNDLFRLPWAHKSILLVAAGIAGFGWVHYFSQASVTPPPTTPAVQNGGASDSNASTPATNPDQTLQARLAPYARRVGGAVLLGFVFGWAFRTFVKIMATFSLLVIGLLTTASYFHIVNVDFTTAAEQKYKDSSAWVSDQAGRVYDAALAHLHSTGGGLIGAYLGFRKKTI